MDFRVAEAGDAEELADVGGGDVFLVLGAVLDDAASNFAADVADFALEVADAGFAGVVANDGDDGVVVEGDVVFGQAGRLRAAF